MIHTIALVERSKFEIQLLRIDSDHYIGVDFLWELPVEHVPIYAIAYKPL